LPSDALSASLRRYQAQSSAPEALALAFAYQCAERVRHLLESEDVARCLDTLAAFIHGRADRTALEQAAAVAAELANRHQGSRSIDGVGHAAVSATYAVANALAGRAIVCADYAAYAMVYGGGGYGAVSDPESFAPENAWQLSKLAELAESFGRASPA
jgi:hypothetical protein